MHSRIYWYKAIHSRIYWHRDIHCRIYWQRDMRSRIYWHRAMHNLFTCGCRSYSYRFGYVTSSNFVNLINVPKLKIEKGLIKGQKGNFIIMHYSELWISIIMCYRHVPQYMIYVSCKRVLYEITLTMLSVIWQLCVWEFKIENCFTAMYTNKYYPFLDNCVIRKYLNTCYMCM